MDPDVALLRLMSAAHDSDEESYKEYWEVIIVWLLKGGFAPTVLHPQIDRPFYPFKQDKLNRWLLKANDQNYRDWEIVHFMSEKIHRVYQLHIPKGVDPMEVKR